MNMKHVALDYFPEFKCLADKCNYTCCYQWRIDIKKPDYTKIKNLRASKETKEKIEHCFKRVRDDSNPYYAHMVMKEDGNCPFLTEQKMCSLQQECGYSILPEVCKIFPRGNCVGFSQWEEFCSTGCEQTVNLLLKRPQGLRLIEIETKQKPYMDEKFLEQKLEKRPVFHYYKEIQMLFMGILQNRKYSLSHRVLLMGLAAQNLQKVKTKTEALEFLKNSLCLLQYDDKTDKFLKSMKRDTEHTGAVIAFNEAVLNNSIAESEIDSFRAKFLKEIYGEFVKVKLDSARGKSKNININIDIEKYTHAKEKFWSIEYVSYAMENILVNRMVHKQFPLNWTHDDSSVWDSYLDFCAEYNIFQVLCACYMVNKEDKSCFAHAVTVCSRMLVHNANLREKIKKEWIDKGLNTLAHIAYLIL